MIRMRRQGIPNPVLGVQNERNGMRPDESFRAWLKMPRSPRLARKAPVIQASTLVNRQLDASSCCVLADVIVNIFRH